MPREYATLVTNSRWYGTEAFWCASGSRPCGRRRPVLRGGKWTWKD
jgi:hypothetical protein